LDGSSPTLVATSRTNRRKYPSAVEVFRTSGPRVDLKELFRELKRRGMRQVLVEGGAETLATVLRSSLWDRLTVYIAPVLIGGKTAPPLLTGPESRDEGDTIHLKRTAVEPMGTGILLTFGPLR
jgi:diaminohydroxyphosphoribosylaminopyrimidine deaminase/5-amino-6-(5-phosphoribosylamino)uracil reductase